MAAFFRLGSSGRSFPRFGCRRCRSSRTGFWRRRRASLRRAWLRSSRRSHPRWSQFRGLRRGHPGRSLLLSFRWRHAGGTRFRPLLRGHPRRSLLLSFRGSHMGGTGFRSRRRAHLMGRRLMSPRDSLRSLTPESFLPPGALAAMVLVIESPVIMMAFPVGAPKRIRPLKTLPVLRLSSVPRLPHRPIPVVRSDNIGVRISVIRAPAVLGSEKEIQDAVQEPVPIIINPRRIRPDPRRGVRVRGRGWVLISLGICRRRDGRDRASSQHDGYQQTKN